MLHLQQFIELHSAFNNSSIIIVGDKHDEDICLLALEAGAEDCINKTHLAPAFMRKAVLLSLRRHRTEKELSQNREQLLACIQNTPNLAVQWYNSRGEVLFWNKISERIFGWKAEEAMGKTIDELIVVSENREFWLHKIQHLATTKGESETEEWTFRYRDGSEGCCISTLLPIPSFDTEPWFVCMDVEITDRKQMEKALQESEERYHTIFNDASDAIFINDVDGCFLDVNQQACDLLGYTRSRLLQMHVEDLFSHEELEQRPIIGERLMAGERTSVERSMLTASNTQLPVEITAKKFKDGRIMSIVRNIAERKQAEEALVRSEEKYRLLVEQQGDAITIFDDRGCIIDVNTSATQLLYHSREEFQQMTLADILSPEDVNDNPVSFDLLEQGAATIKQRTMRRKDGSRVATEVHTKRLGNGHFLASVRDLTERIDVQRQLEREKELSDSIINSLPGLFYLFTKDGKYLRWNRLQEIITGYSGPEISTMKPLEFTAVEDADLVQAAIEKTFAAGYSTVEANLLTKAGKKIPFYFTGIKIEYQGTDCLLGTGIDLSALKNLEEELSRQKIAEQKKIIRAMIETEEKEKNKLGMELHDDVNQILSVVKMYLTILASGEVPEGISLPKTIKLLNSAIDEIRHLSHSLAVSYKFEAGLVEALQDVVDKFKLTRDFSIRLVTPPRLDEFISNPQKLALYRIVQEQLTNISKHAKATAVTVAIELTLEEVLLKITDNGKGFNPQKAARGLGLTTIANRAEALEGTVNINSAPGAGTVVQVIIPLKQE